ncbi:MAG: 23S rRNA (pseudouridine(1915)-N(3))-methyltransferase RlmH [Gammaproteobacteria bacterium]
MRISVLAVSRRLPAWLETGIKDYARRLPPEIKPVIHEVTPARRRTGVSAEKNMADEARRLLSALPDGVRIIILEEGGRQLTTRQWAEQLQEWQLDNINIAFVIGGADGLAPAIREMAHDSLSLSTLTLPHGIARLLLVEQLYRAWSLLNNHPYHRE